MEEVLYLTHRIPYPPDKGDKIRSFHMLRYLAERYTVHLGCFCDDPADREHVSALDEYCGSVNVLDLSPVAARIRSLTGLLTGEALSVPYYTNAQMQRWVDHVLAAQKIDAVVVYSSPMAQYVLGPEHADLNRIMDFVDVDSDKWRQYADRRRGLGRWVYGRESERLLEFEQQVTREFDAVTFVSDNEKCLYNELDPETTAKHHAMRNGVDMSYFDVGAVFESPFDDGARPIVFTGMMNYWPNVDAVQWFATEIFPEILKAVPDTEFWIVGGSPTSAVVALDGLPNVHVTGRVPDVRPYLRHSACAVAPLRVARGVQNKVLEALAMGCRAVCTDAALAGLDRIDRCPAVRAQSEPEIIAAVVAAVGAAGKDRRGPEYVLKHYDWDGNLGLLGQLISAPSE